MSFEMNIVGIEDSDETQSNSSFLIQFDVKQKAGGLICIFFFFTTPTFDKCVLRVFVNGKRVSYVIMLLYKIIV